MDCGPPSSSATEFSRQKYWSGLSLPSQGDLPYPGIKSGSPALQADSLWSEPPVKPMGYSPWSWKESKMTETNTFTFSSICNLGFDTHSSLQVPRILCIFTCCFFCLKYTFLLLCPRKSYSFFKLQLKCILLCEDFFYPLWSHNIWLYPLKFQPYAHLTSITGLTTQSHNCLFSYPSPCLSSHLSPVTDSRGHRPWLVHICVST